jgi:hypothetical protein
MPEPTTRKPASRNTVKIIALLTATAITAGIVLIAVLSGGPTATGTGLTAGEFGDAPTIGDRAGEGMVIELADEDDPDKQIGEIRFSSFDPITPTTRTVEDPVAWLYLDDGRMALIEAERGRFETPLGQKRPESGRLEGTPVIRLFDPVPGGGRPDPATATPLMTATMDQPLDFDLRSATIRTAGRLEVVSAQFDFIGHDIYAVLNEQRERIDLLEVRRGERLTHRPLPEGAESAAAEPARPAPVTRERFSGPQPKRGSVILASSSQPTTTPIAETLYEAVFAGGVRVVRGELEMDSDELNVWARLIDNKLPDRDEAGIDTPTLPIASTLPALAQLVQLAIAAQPEGTISNTAPAPSTPGASQPADPPATLTWTGPLTLKSIAADDMPTALARDDLAIRATGQRTGPVRFADLSNGTRGEATALEYYDTTQRIMLESQSAGVRIESPRSGTLLGVRRLDVSLPTGSVAIAGEGELRAREHDTLDASGERRRRLIRWSDGAEFLFQVLDGEMTDQIRLANFSGRVFGVSDDAEVEGDALSAQFAAAESGNPFVRLVRIDAAKTADGRGGAIRGDDMEVWFREDETGGDLQPSRVIVRGNAEGTQANGSAFDADLINASLEPDENGDVAVHRVQAEGVRRLADGKGTSAVADRIDANLPEQTAVLEGEASVSREGTVMTGEWLDFNGKQNRVIARGPGTLAHERDGSAFEASWQKAMVFNDTTGDVTVLGSARGRLVSPDGSEDTFRGERVDLTLVPAGEVGVASESSQQNRLRTATLIGVPEAGRDGRARMERRRYALRDGARKADEIYFLEGDRIDIDDRAGTLHVNAPGLMLLADRRPDGSRPPRRDDVLSGGSGDRGVTMIEWTGSMSMDRSGGAITANRDVRVTHKRLSDGLVSTIEAEQLTARVANLDGGPAGDADTDLRDVEASGSVYAVVGLHEVVADRLRYDAQRGVLTANADTGNLITLFNNEDGTAVNARGLRWDLNSDRVSLDQPTPIVVPR